MYHPQAAAVWTAGEPNMAAADTVTVVIGILHTMRLLEGRHRVAICMGMPPTCEMIHARRMNGPGCNRQLNEQTPTTLSRGMAPAISGVFMQTGVATPGGISD